MVRIAQVIPPHDRLSQLHLLDTHHLRGTRVNLTYLMLDNWVYTLEKQKIDDIFSI